MSGIASAILMGCHSATPIDWSFIDPGESALYVRQGSDGQPRLFAAEPGQTTPTLTLWADDPLYVVLVRATLANLGLLPGPINLEAVARGPWPSEYRAFLLAGDPRVRGDLTHAQLEDALGARFLPLFEASRCIELGGCFRHTPSSGEALDCEQPCLGPPNVAAPEPPALPDPPVLTPCPENWIERAISGVVVCDPPIARTCAPGEAQGHLDVECRPIGTPCGVGPWPLDLPMGRTPAFVLAGALDPPDGSMARPYPTIAAAVAAAADGSAIVVGEGAYAENLIIAGDVVIAGLCPARSTITPADADRPLIEATVGSVLTIADLHLVPTRAAAILAHGAELHGRGLHIEGGERGLWILDGSSFEGRDLLIEAQTTLGIDIDSSVLELDGVVIDRASQGGLITGTATTLIRGSVISDNLGPGLRFVDDREVTITNTRFSGNLSAGLHLDRGSAATVSDLLVVGTAGSASSRGISVTQASMLAATRVDIRGPNGQGLTVGDETIPPLGPASGGTLTDSVITESSGPCAVVSASSFGFERVLIEGCRALGIDLRESTTQARDLTLRKVHQFPVPLNGYGLAISGASAVDLDRALIEDLTIGLLVASSTPAATGVLRASDLSIRQALGFAVSIDGGVILELRRAEVADGAGILVGSGRFTGSSILEDLAVRDVHTNGIFLHKGTSSGKRISIERATQSGLRLDQNRVELEDLRIDGTVVRSGANLVKNRGVGIAVGVSHDMRTLEYADALLTRFISEDNQGPGLWLGLASEHRFVDGWISGVSPRVATEKRGFDRAEVFGDIRFPTP